MLILLLLPRRGIQKKKKNLHFLLGVVFGTSTHLHFMADVAIKQGGLDILNKSNGGKKREDKMSEALIIALLQGEKNIAAI